MIRSLLIALTLSTVACAAGSEPDTDSASGAATATASSGISATVTPDVIVASDPKCFLDIQRPVVVVPGNDAATKAIAKDLEGAIGLRLTAADMCDPNDASVNMEQFFSTKTNERGVLSLVVHTNDPQPSKESFVFDLKTGKRLLLGDILTKSGIATVTAACKAGSESVENPESCANIEASSRNLQLDAKGLTVDLDMTNDITVPWSKLDRNLLPSAIIDYLKR